MKKYAKLFETVILVLALAIPAWLFYNFWWGGKRSKKGASSRPMVTVPVSGTSKAVSAAGTPAPQSSTAAPAAMPVHVSSPVAAPTASAAVRLASPDAAPGGDSMVSDIAVSTAAQVVSFSMKKGRNPFLSPEDYDRIKAEEERKRLEAERQAYEDELAKRAIKEKQKIIALGLPQDISLQGLIGDQAIINGRTISIGQTINDAKLVKVGIDYVILRSGYRNFYYNMDGKMFEIDRNGKRVQR